ncbi:MAG: tetratricopeptide repeat protein [Candidatus Thiodiazotropha sp.]|jgi:TPR repeat protein
MASDYWCRLGAGIALSILSDNVASEHVVDGIRAYEKKQYKQAFSIFASHADIANPMAMYYLSALYLSGMGVEQNEEMAFEYCKRAAEEGIIDAQFQLGMMYLNAVGMMQEDNDKALEWLWRAADSGHQQAREMFDFVINSDFTYGC